MAALRRLWPLIGFVVLALGLTWPLPLHLTTRLTGAPGGDTGVYVWNLWVFRHELLDGNWPFFTEEVFAMAGGTDLSAHNYTVFADLVALPWLGALGVVRTFNLVYLFLIATSGYATYFLVKRLVGSRTDAWVAGAAFAASPYLIARGTAHFSLAAAAPLPIFLLCVINALGSGRIHHAVFAGIAMGWAGYCDVYYTIYCALMGALLVAHHLWRLERTGPAGVPATRTLRGGVAAPSARGAIRVVNALIGAGALIVAWRLWHGESSTVIFGQTLSFRTLYTPMLILTVLVLVRQQLVWGISVRRRPESLQWGRAAWLISALLVSAAVVLTPVIAGLINRLMTGSFPSPQINWRSSPPGMDLLDLVVPNPHHPWIGGPALGWITSRGPLAYPEFVGSLSIVALSIVALAAWRVRSAIPRLWIVFTVLFALLALGPFVQVGGVNTYIPGPWWLLRHAPVVGLARSPARFAVLAALGLSVMLGYALAALRRRSPERWRRVFPAAMGLMAFELLPAPRPLYDAAVPAVYDVIRQDANPSVRVIELPGGVRDGTSSIGDFSASAQFYQTVHAKPLIGGYQSRVSEREKSAALESPVLAALYRLSEGHPLAPDAAARAWAARKSFLRRSCLGYVVFEGRASADMRRFATELLDLVPMAADAGRELFAPASRPMNEPCATGPSRRRFRFSL